MIDSNTLQDFTRTLQKYKAGKASLERRVVSAENWWKLRSRAQERREEPDSYRSVSGWLHNVIVSKHADAMDAFPEPVILPREPGDEREAGMLSAVVPCILEANRFEQVYDAAMWQKLKTGTAAYRVVWDSDKCGGLGDIAIERVDLLNLFWEPGVDDIQKSRYVFCTHLEDEDLLCQRYPRLTGRLGTSAFRPTRFLYDDAVDLTGKQTVVEVYYKKRGVLHYCKYVGDTVLYATENQSLPLEGEGKKASPPWGEKLSSEARLMRGEEQRKPYPSSAPAGHLKVNCRAAAREAPLGDPPEGEGWPGADRFPSSGAARHLPPEGEGYKEIGLYAHGLYPFVLDPLFPVEGSPCGYGFVDLCRNTQTAIDLLRTAFVKNTMVGATPRYFQRIDGSVNEREFTDLDRALVHVTGNLGEDSLRPIPYTPLSGTYLQVLNSTIAELRETSGNTETATGTVHSGVTAASAIAALQEASGKGSRDASRASYVAFGKIVELIIELIRQFYTLPRRFRITGDMGRPDFLSYSNAGLQPRPAMRWPGTDGERRAAEELRFCAAGGGCSKSGISAAVGKPEESVSPNGFPGTARWIVGPYGGADGGALLRLPVFDVRVTAQKRSAYARLSQNELAMQLYKLGLFEPGRELQALQCLELMDFDGKEELRRRLTAASSVREKLEQLGRYKRMALLLARRYRPDLLPGLAGFDEASPLGGRSPRGASLAAARQFTFSSREAGDEGGIAPGDPTVPARQATAEGVMP